MAAERPLILRAATQADADGITDVQVASWRVGYQHLFDDDVLFADDFDSSRRAYWNRWAFWPGGRVAVATRPSEVGREQVICFTSYGPERERARGHTGRGEITACYCSPTIWGTGVADRLMDFTELRLRAEGFALAVLWVIEQNPRARRFYERRGWEPTGITADSNVGSTTITELEYWIELK